MCNATTLPTTEPAPAMKCERETCDRCGGGGRMPFAVYGGVCFKCNGKGEVLTKRGRAASHYLLGLRTRKASEIEVGQHIRMGQITRGGQPYDATAKVTEIGWDLDGSKWLDSKTGEWRPFYAIKTTRGTQLVANPETDTVVRVFTTEENAEHLRQTMEYQASLTQQGKPRRR
jgi:hypothetical protein